MYDKFKLDQLINTALVNLSSDTIKCMLVTSSYTPTNGSSGDQYASTPQAYEATTGTAYVAGGPTISGQTCSILSGDTVTFSCSNIVIAQDASNGFTNAYYAVLYKSTGTLSTSPLICYASFGANKSNQGGSLTLQIDSAGVFTLT
jgi:hypothetical protein